MKVENKSLIIENLSISYNGARIIDGFSLDCSPGKCYALTGASGTGKTSVFKAIMGLIPYEGNIIMPESIRIAPVFQEDRLCEGSSVLSNIMLAADRSVSKSDVKSALDAFGMGEKIYSRIYNLSGGMCKRTSILRAMFAPHNFLLMDEPFNGLDDSTKQSVMNYIIEKSSGDTILFITHNLSEAEYMNACCLSL